MKLSVFPSSIETSRALILRLVEIMNEEPDRVFNIAVSGGNTPALMFDLWANEYMEITPWDRMRIYWVDERCVPPDDSDSNYGMMRNLLLDDGHTSSIFPGQEDLLTSNSIYVVSAHPRNGQKRIAMTGYPIQNARYVIFLITGKNKADVVEEICNSGDTGPAAYVAHHAQNVELFMDKGAAAYIEDPNKKMS